MAKAVLWTVAVLAIMGAGGAWLAVHDYRQGKLAALSAPPLQRFARENSALAASGRPVALVAIGDSRIARWSPLPEPGPEGAFVLRGIGGETSNQTAARFATDALALAPKAVLVMTGINDIVASSFATQEHRQAIQAQIVANLRTIAALSATAGVCLYLSTIAPPAHFDLLQTLIWNQRIRRDVVSVNEEIRRLSGRNLVILDMDRVFDVRAQGWLDPALRQDALHFSARAYDLLNRHLRGLGSGMTDCR